MKFYEKPKVTLVEIVSEAKIANQDEEGTLNLSVPTTWWPEETDF